MTEPYTPDVERIKNWYLAANPFGEAEFDRAIRKVQAEAWDECHTATCPDLGDWRHACVNPYEKGTTDE